MSLRLSSCLLFFVLVCPMMSVSQTTLTIAAAADLSPLESDLAGSFGKNYPPAHLRFVTESSAALAQQIENGAPYDVFLSANAAFVERLALNRKIQPDSVLNYTEGRVGLLWRDGKEHPLKDLSADWIHFLALPNPKLAPYGVAAQQAIKHAGIWELVRKKVVYGENVRQALQLFTSGNADAVLTSESLLIGKHGQIIPAGWHQPILQKAGIVATTKNAEAAHAFLHFLTSPVGQAVFARFGFSSPR